MIDLDEFCRRIPEVLAGAGFKADTCILATRIGTYALRELGFRVQPVPVTVAAMNAAYVQMLSEREPDWQGPQGEDLERYTQKWKRAGAWSVMLGYGIDPRRVARGEKPGYDGHLAIGVDRTYLLDPTIGQASRPEKGITLGPLTMYAPEFLRGEQQTMSPEVHTPMVVYSHHATSAYLRASDWTETRAQHPLVRSLINAVKEVA